jgi:hypothetical protein
VDWINPTGAKKVHSLVDKVYKQKNLEIAWERVQANRGSGGVDGQSLEQFAAQLSQQLGQLQRELREETYQPQPVRQVQIPKAGKPGEFRTLGIPTIYDRVCQQALLNRLEPIFEPIFDDANIGYRRGRSTKDAMRKVWKEIQSGQFRVNHRRRTAQVPNRPEGGAGVRQHWLQPQRESARLRSHRNTLDPFWFPQHVRFNWRFDGRAQRIPSLSHLLALWAFVRNVKFIFLSSTPGLIGEWCEAPKTIRRAVVDFKPLPVYRPQGLRP